MNKSDHSGWRIAAYCPLAFSQGTRAASVSRACECGHTGMQGDVMSQRVCSSPGLWAHRDAERRDVSEDVFQPWPGYHWCSFTELFSPSSSHPQLRALFSASSSHPQLRVLGLPVGSRLVCAGLGEGPGPCCCFSAPSSALQLGPWDTLAEASPPGLTARAGPLQQLPGLLFSPRSAFAKATK